MTRSISIGTQIVAPCGYGVLDQGITYYFLKSAKNETVYVIDFVVRPTKPVKKKYGEKVKIVNISPTPIPVLVAMPREQFEEGILDNQILRIEKQALLPPWLSELEGLNLSILDSERQGVAKPHRERIDRQLEIIYPLVKNIDIIINSDDPDLLINNHARSCTPKQNETRTRLAFYAYVIFGRNRFALHYPSHRIGRWCRSNLISKIKQGRPSAKYGKGHGNNASPELIEKAVECYQRERGPGIELTTIFRTFMSHDLGCKEVVGRDGNYRFQHPLGAPILTWHMFRYYIEKEIGLRNVQLALYGRVRTRTKIDPHRGSFTQNVCNISERTERDAYAIVDLPRGLVEGHPLPPLYVARGRDVASGLILGIGFSQGGEKASAYRMEQFCRAINKVLFCSFFGYEITEDQWPSIGLSDWEVQDRGAGSTNGAFARDQEFQPVIREITPSYSAQSKATIESSNPKNRSHDDAPNFIASDKRVFELVRRELLRVISDNERFNIKNRIPPDLLSHIPRATPVALYRELDRRGRNDSQKIPFEDAVRTFLTRLKAKVDRRGVWLHKQCFSSDELIKSKLFGRIRGPQEPEVEVYVMDACLRQIWIDVDGQLIQLKILSPLRVNNEVMYLSLEELKEREQILNQFDRNHEEHRQAHTSKIERDYFEQTGKKWNGGKTVAGRPKRGSQGAKKEAAESKNAVHGSTGK